MANDTHLKVIEGGNAQDLAPGTATWADSVRKDAKSLAGKLDEGYMDLAKLLWEIYDTPIDGDRKNAPIFTKWGYSSFSDYVEQELGINKKKAQRLRSIWYNLEVRLADSIPLELRQRIVALGFSKVRELVRVLSARNADKWVEKAEQLSYPKLCKAIRTYKDDIEKYQVEKAVSQEEADQAFASGDTIFSDSSESEPAPVDSVLGQAITDDSIPAPLENNTGMVNKNFKFAPEQWSVVKEAIEAAKKLSGSDLDGNNLHLIALEFLASNFEGKVTTKNKVRMLVSMAKLMDLNLVVVDHGDIIFGLETLEDLAKKE